jgi:hypothetical protein
MSRYAVVIMLMASLSCWAQSAKPPGYVGSETCGTCHQDVAKAFPKSPHEAVDSGDSVHGFQGRACESCHGPGAKHAMSLAPAHGGGTA